MTEDNRKLVKEIEKLYLGDFFKPWFRPTKLKREMIAMLMLSIERQEIEINEYKKGMDDISNIMKRKNVSAELSNEIYSNILKPLEETWLPEMKKPHEGALLR